VTYFEEIVEGRRTELGSVLFTADDIKRFAMAYDPQPFHIDEVAAGESHFGGLIASGWHVAATWMRLTVANWNRLADEAKRAGRPQARLGPSPGFKNMVWAKPVRPGDELAFFSQVVGKKASASRPGWGLVMMLNGAVDQGGETAFKFDGVVFWERLPSLQNP